MKSFFLHTRLIKHSFLFQKISSSKQETPQYIFQETKKELQNNIESSIEEKVNTFVSFMKEIQQKQDTDPLYSVPDGTQEEIQRRVNEIDPLLDVVRGIDAIKADTYIKVLEKWGIVVKKEEAIFVEKTPSVEIIPFANKQKIYDYLKTHPTGYIPGENDKPYNDGENAISALQEIDSNASLKTISFEDFSEAHRFISSIPDLQRSLAESFQQGKINTSPEVAAFLQDQKEVASFFRFLNEGVQNNSDVLKLQSFLSLLSHDESATLAQNGKRKGIDGKYGYATSQAVQKLSSLLSENAKINKDVNLAIDFKTEEILVDEFENADQYIFMVDSSGSYGTDKTKSFLRELANKLPTDKPMLIVPHGTQYAKGSIETNSTDLKNTNYLSQITTEVMKSNMNGKNEEKGKTKEHFDVLREQLISCLDNSEIKNTTLIFNIDSDGSVQKRGEKHYVPNHPTHGKPMTSTWEDLEDEILDRGENKPLAEQLREKNIKIKFITMGGESLGNALKDLIGDKDSKAPVIQIIPHTEKGTEIKFTIQKPVQTKRIRFTNI